MVAVTRARAKREAATTPATTIPSTTPRGRRTRKVSAPQRPPATPATPLRRRRSGRLTNRKAGLTPNHRESPSTKPKRTTLQSAMKRLILEQKAVKRSEPRARPPSRAAAASSAPSAPSASGSRVDSNSGWVQCGGSLRRENDAELTAQYQQQQQIALMKRTEDVYKEQSKVMMKQYDITYQWYDRMMTEGLRNGPQESATGLPVVMGRALGSIVGEEDDETIRKMHNALQREDSVMEDEEISSNAPTEEDTQDVYSEHSSSNPGRADSGVKMQLQDCAPGVRYSLIASPTRILEHPWVD